MEQPPHVIKRTDGHTEPYDNHKVYTSCYAACLNASLTKEEAERISALVMNGVDQWIQSRSIATSEEIFEQVIYLLAQHNKESSLMYKTHRNTNTEV